MKKIKIGREQIWLILLKHQLHILVIGTIQIKQKMLVERWVFRWCRCSITQQPWQTVPFTGTGNRKRNMRWLYLNQVLGLLWFRYDLLRFGTCWRRWQWWKFLQLDCHFLGGTFLGQLLAAAFSLWFQVTTSALSQVRSHMCGARLFDKLCYKQRQQQNATIIPAPLAFWQNLKIRRRCSFKISNGMYGQ